MDTRAPPPQVMAEPKRQQRSAAYVYHTGRFAFNRVYKTNLRPLIIFLGCLSALWSLAACVGFFKSINTDKRQGVPKLATFAIVLGAVYMAIFLIETVGVIAGIMQRLALVRIYAILSFVAIGLTAAGGLFQVVIHFTAKSDILKICNNLTNGRTAAVYPFGLFGPSRHETISPTEAARWCNDAYDRNSWQDIVSLLITIFLACSYSVLAWGFYRQVLDPTSVVNSLRAPSNQTRLEMYPQHYNPPYNASVPNLGYGAPYGGAPPYGAAPYGGAPYGGAPYAGAPYAGAPYAGAPYPAGAAYAPPPGVPPVARDDGKPPGYTGGEGAAGYGSDDKDKENPFADFDERTEHDVTSRPAPGGPNSFR
ncbi:hypothetical protein B0H15DRAFT_1024000 [Mycena belliarum]|uniref:Tetraspanin n=1 Tax=Mycena belliarum TaxID=1033014 RepID=A0AAD6U0L5_9AGAR|nr:hypothetical protein B0H15DRAFT_1024000 [Mycena belliae]